MGRKNKRGDRGSTETDTTTSKRFHEEQNMATADAADEVEETMGDAEEPSLHEIKKYVSRNSNNSFRHPAQEQSIC